MENFLFALDATLPIFLLMVCGYVFRRIGLLKKELTDGLNKFVFKVALPVLLFQDLSTQDFKSTWNGRFFVFCFVVTLISIALAAIFAHFLLRGRDLAERGEFIQASYRSSAALLGLAFIENIYGEGNSGMAPVMILASVPLYNICAVTVLLLTSPSKDGHEAPAALIKRTLIGIAKNPIILGILIGFAWSIFKLPVPRIADKLLGSIADLATPLGLMSMGAALELKEAEGVLKPAIFAAFTKLFLFAALFLPVAIYLGFRGPELVALLVALGSSTTVSCYIMARNMGHEGTLTSVTVMITTFCCSGTLTFWLWALRSMGVI